MSKNEFREKHFVITGKLSAMTRNYASKHIQRIGGHFQTSVTRTTDYLIVGTIRNGKCTNKLCKAKKLQAQGSPIVILEQEDFYEMLKNSKE